MTESEHEAKQPSKKNPGAGQRKPGDSPTQEDAEQHRTDSPTNPVVEARNRDRLHAQEASWRRGEEKKGQKET